MSDELDVVRDYRRRLAALPASGRVHRPAWGIAIAALVAASVVGALLARPGGGGAALAVERRDEAVLVRIRDATAGPEALSRALRAEGVNAFVGVAPATPDAVGRWVEVRATDAVGRDDPRAAARIGVDGATVRIPRDLHARPVLIAGVAPAPGQAPVFGPNGRDERCPPDCGDAP